MTESSVERNPVDELAEEFVERFRKGDKPSLEEYVNRRPDLANEIRDVFPTLVMMEEVRPGPDEVNGEYREAAAAMEPLGDFRILREAGRGGMGVVYEAEQISLRRRVALKVLPLAGALDSRQLQRFKNEAQAAAGLHHTNIVPVYYVGCDRGIHYYAMQYIEGQSLAALISDLRRREKGGGGPTSEAAFSLRDGSQPDAKVNIDLPPTIDATPTEALAASTAPIAAISTEHATKNPAYFQSVAKLAIQAAEALEHAHQMGVVHRDIKPGNLLLDERGNLWVADFGLAQFNSEANLTMTGDILGTLRYMSPEQAMAQRVIIDHRTDIYSLGVTLYELFTLRPAVPGKARPEILRRIAFEEPKAPRRINKSIPAELETIVMKAMEKNPADRYQTAQGLADDLRRFMEDKPIHARRPGLVARARKWARRHTDWVAAAALFLMLAMVGTGVAAWLIAGERDVAERRRHDAEASLQVAREAVDTMYTQVAEKWLANQPHLEQVQREFLEKALKFYEELTQEQGSDPKVRQEKVKAYQRVGAIQNSLGPPEKAEESYRQALALAEKLVADFPEEPAYHIDVAKSLDSLSGILRGTGRRQEAEQALLRAQDLLEKVTGSFTEDAVYRECLAKIYLNLGIQLMVGGQAGGRSRAKESDQYYRKALDLLEKLVAQFPTESNYRVSLGTTHSALGTLQYGYMDGEIGEAEKSLLRAVEHFEQLLTRFPTHSTSRRKLADVQLRLGFVFSVTTRPKQAEQAFRKALESAEQLVLQFPSIPDYRRQVAELLLQLGQLLASTGRLADADLVYRRAVDILERLVVELPNVNVRPGNFQRVSWALAHILNKLGKSNDAEIASRRVLAVAEKLATDFPGERCTQTLLMDGHAIVGLFLETNTDRVVDAAEAYRQALAVHNKRMAVDPASQKEIHPTMGNPNYCYIRLADLLWQLGKHEEGKEVYRKLFEYYEQTGTYKNEQIWHLATCPYSELRDPALAVQLAKKELEKRPKDRGMWSSLGAAYYGAGDWKAALAGWQKAESLGADGADFFFLFAMAHWQMGNKDQAQRWYGKGVEEATKFKMDPRYTRRFRAEAAELLGIDKK